MRFRNSFLLGFYQKSLITLNLTNNKIWKWVFLPRNMVFLKVFMPLSNSLHLFSAKVLNISVRYIPVYLTDSHVILEVRLTNFKTNKLNSHRMMNFMKPRKWEYNKHFWNTIGRTISSRLINSLLGGYSWAEILIVKGCQPCEDKEERQKMQGPWRASKV